MGSWAALAGIVRGMARGDCFNELTLEFRSTDIAACDCTTGHTSDGISVSRLWKSLPTTSKGTNGAICACLVVGGHGGDCLNEFTLEFGLDIWHNCSVA